MLDIEKLREQNMITPDGARTPITEGFRRIKRHVLANLANPGAGTAANLLMVTSPLAGEGKTFCTINLAISIAMEIDRRVLLVDADVAKPSVPRVLGIEAERGLMDVVLDPSIDLADVLLRTNIEGFSVLPAGTQHQHATEMLASDAMRTLLKEMAERYHDRIIIFDSPPLLAASESAVLATRMGQIVGGGGSGQNHGDRAQGCAEPYRIVQSCRPPAKQGRSARAPGIMAMAMAMARNKIPRKLSASSTISRGSRSQPWLLH
jgi:exopolysaccharide/PEP-CTERM locus tyrosine autokinase